MINEKMIQRKREKMYLVCFNTKCYFLLNNQDCGLKDVSLDNGGKCTQFLNKELIKKVENGEIYKSKEGLKNER